MSKIKISVIIPVYNTEQYLEECLDSVLKQTLKEIEVICIDDGSSDNSAEILKRYAAKDNRILIFHQKHSGGGKARNLGLEKAHGEYLAFLDSDDFYHQTYCEKMYLKAIETSADIVICAAQTLDTKTKQYTPMKQSLQINYLPDKPIFNYEDMPRYIFNAFQNWNWNKLFKHSFIKTHNIKFQEIWRTNDLLFTCIALIKASKITTVQEDLIYYRIGLKNNCQSTNKHYPLDFYKAFKALKQYLSNENIYNKVKESYINWAMESVVYNISSQPSLKDQKFLINKIFPNCFEDLDFKSIPNITIHHSKMYDKFDDFYQKYKAFHSSVLILKNLIYSVKYHENGQIRSIKIFTLPVFKTKKKNNGIIKYYFFGAPVLQIKGKDHV